MPNQEIFDVLVIVVKWFVFVEIVALFGLFFLAVREVEKILQK